MGLRLAPAAEILVGDRGPRNRTFVLARDPFGVKPLYYRDVDGIVCSGRDPSHPRPSGGRGVDLQAVD
jgi:hypothetical protein